MRIAKLFGATLLFMIAACLEPDGKSAPEAEDESSETVERSSDELAVTQQKLESGLCGNIAGLQANAAWPMSGGCPTHAAQSSQFGPTAASKNWSTYLFGNVKGSPAIAADGSIFVGSDGNRFFKINSTTGAILKQEPTWGRVRSAPAIGADGTVYVGDDSGTFYAVNPTTLKAKWTVSWIGAVNSSPAIAPDGTIYFGSDDDKLYAYKPDGTPKWSHLTGTDVRSSPAIGTDGTVYFGSDITLYALNPSNGTKKWSKIIGFPITSSPAVGRFGRVYIGAGDKLLAYNATDGTFLWEKSLGSCTIYAPAIGQNGVIYVGTGFSFSTGGSLYALSPDGEILWHFDVLGGVQSTPIIDRAGNIYFGANDNKIYAVDAAGNQIWKYATLGNVQSSPALAPNGAVIVGANDNNLYSIGLGATRVNNGGACTSDAQCMPGLVCGVNNGPRFGLGATARACVVPTCENKVQDPGETEVDCGGPCGSCTNVCSLACKLGDQVSPPALEVLPFSKASFVRATYGTYQVGTQKVGLAGGNVLRFEDRGDGAGRLALFEGARTNRLRFSEQLTHAPEWRMPTGGTPIVTTEDYAASPQDSPTAERLVAPAAGYPSRTQTVGTNVPAGVLSAWLRLTDATGAASSTRPVLYDSQNRWFSTTTPWALQGTWTRQSMATTASAASVDLAFSHKAGWPGSATQFPQLGAADFVVWGLQLEEGAFASSYIPTTDDIETRMADRLVFEAADVPAWVRTGMWQIDVAPIFASSEITAGDEMMLVAWENGGLSLGRDAAGGVLKIVSGNASARLSLDWAKNTKLTIMLDFGAHTMAVRGASRGGGSIGTGATAIPTGRVGIGSALSGTKSAFARISELRRVGVASQACVSDPDCVLCGDGFVTGEEGCEPSLNARCSSACQVSEMPTACATDGDCSQGQVCGLGNGLSFGANAYESFCWPAALCPTQCGDTFSACGLCTSCTPNCTGAACGQRMDDGCGGICEGSCQVGQSGCFDNRDCRSGSICLSQGTSTVCAPPPGYDVIDQGYVLPKLLPNGQKCLLGPLCAEQDCEQSCDGFCDVRGACLAAADAAIVCPQTCPGACDTNGRCYQNGQPKAPITTSEPAPANAVGELRGALSIDSKGAASYSIPIEVAPGKGGHEPELAFVYSSSGGDGPLGLGWSVTGVSAIAICDRKPASDMLSKSYGGPALCLDGEPLQPVMASTGVPLSSFANQSFFLRQRNGAEYFVETHFTTWQGGGGGLPTLGMRLIPGTSFTVHTTDGRKLVFGGSEAYLLRGGRDPLMGPSDIRKWALASVEDRHGNRISFEYQKGSTSLTAPSIYFPDQESFYERPPGSVTELGIDAEIVLRRIAYNADPTGRFSSEVTFHYNEDRLNFGSPAQPCDANGYCSRRPSVHTKYWHGGPQSDLFLLDRVEVHTMGRLIRSYDLGHTTTAEGRNTLLSWLQECGYSSVGTSCLPAAQFDYGNPKESDVTEMGSRHLELERYETSREYPWQYQRANAATFDADGDGDDEYFVFGNDGALWTTVNVAGTPISSRGDARTDNPLKFRKVAEGTQFPTFLLFRKHEGNDERFTLPFGMYPVDWNRDGLGDLVIWGLDQAQHDDGEQVVSRCSGITGSICGANRGAGRLDTVVPLGVWVYEAQLENSSLRFNVRRVLTEANTPEGTGLAALAGRGSPAGIGLDASISNPGVRPHAHVTPFDYNGDGLTDILYCSNGGGDKGVLALATGAHLGDRWLNSLEPQIASQLGGTPPFRFIPLSGINSDFCRRAVPIATRSDRSDLWDPETNTVLTEIDEPVVFKEKVFGSVKLKDYDLQVLELNGDDLPDLLLHKKNDTTGAFQWWFNTGSGFFNQKAVGFVPGGTSSAPFCEMKYLSAAVVADFNSDGLSDIVLPACGTDPKRITGMKIFNASRSSNGQISFVVDNVTGTSLTPNGACDDAESWAPKDNPFRSFVGDFDGDGDRDLRVVGQEWDNGTDSSSNDACSRVPKQRKCCIPERDSAGNVTDFECYINGDVLSHDGKCQAQDVVYNTAIWKFFVTDVWNRTYDREEEASWYHLSRIRTSAVGGRNGHQLDIRYAGGAGAVQWPIAPGGCADLPVAVSGRRSAADSYAEPPTLMQDRARRVYQRVAGGGGCLSPAASWCAGRLEGVVVSAFSERSGDGSANAAAWASCADTRLYYENAVTNAWGGFQGFERVARISRTGGVIRQSELDEYDLSAVPFSAVASLEIMGAVSVAAAPTPPVLTPNVAYPFEAIPIKTTVGTPLSDEVARVQTTSRQLGFLTSLTTGDITVRSASSLPALRGITAGLSPFTAWHTFWGDLSGSGDTFPMIGTQVVPIMEETVIQENDVTLSVQGAWAAYTPMGFPAERVSWQSSSVGIAALQAAVPSLASALGEGASSPIGTTVPAAWTDALPGIVSIDIERSTSHVLNDTVVPWPARQGHVLPPSARWTASAAPTEGSSRDTRASVEFYAYGAEGSLRGTGSITPEGHVINYVFQRTQSGFVFQMDQAAAGSCEPTCAKSFRFEPDEFELFAAASVNPAGHRAAATHDYATGKPLSVKHPDGNETKWTYDAFGRTASEEQVGARGLWISFFEPAEPTQVSTSDAEGTLPVRALFKHMRVKLAGLTTIEDFEETWFNADGSTVRSGAAGLDGTAVWLEKEYDANGWLVRESNPHVSATSATQGTIRTVYDRLGRVTQVSAPSPRGQGDGVVQYTYASLGLRESISTEYLHDGAHAATTAVRVQTSQADDPDVLTAFDPMGRKVASVQIPTVASAPDAVTRLVLGVDGVPTSVSGPDLGAITWAYDSQGRPLSMNDPESGHRAWGYDAYGRVRALVDNTTSLAMDYDVLDRTTAERTIASSLSAPLDTFWDWDLSAEDRANGFPPLVQNRGKLVGVRRSDGLAQSLTYDGVLAQKDSSTTRVPIAAGGHIDMVTGFHYDDRARLDEVFYPGALGRSQRLHYNVAGNVASVGAVLGAGQPERELWKFTSTFESYLYADVEVDQGRLQEHRVYNTGSATLRQFESRWQGSLASQETLSRDDLGRVVGRTRLGESLPSSFTYDAYGRLHQRLAGAGPQASAVEAYSYSTGGRVAGVNNATVQPHSAFAGAAGRMSGSSGDISYDYTPAYGLMRSITGQWNSRQIDTRLSYDNDRRVRSVESGIEHVTFDYTADGERVSRLFVGEDGEQQFSTYAGRLYERTADSDGSVSHLFRFVDPEGKTVFEERVSEGPSGPTTTDAHALVRDHLGSVVAVARPNSSPMIQSFDTFGSVIASVDSTELGFTGHRKVGDDARGILSLVDMGGRFFEPHVGQFAQPDPVLSGIEHPQGFNRRAYVMNDPLNSVDPTGYEACQSQRVDGPGGGGGGCVPPTQLGLPDPGTRAKLKGWEKGRQQNREKRQFKRKDEKRREKAKERFNKGPYKPVSPGGPTLAETSRGGGQRGGVGPKAGTQVDGRPTPNFVLDAFQDRHGQEIDEMYQSIAKGLYTLYEIGSGLRALGGLGRALLSRGMGKIALRGGTKAVGGVADDAAVAATGRTAAKEGANAADDLLQAASKACFPSGTLVETSRGLVPIEEIGVGDRVWAYEAAEGAWDFHVVSRTFVHSSGDSVQRLGVYGDEIVATVNHPFCVADGKDLRSRPSALDLAENCKDEGRWIEAGQLQVGDVLVTTGGTARIEESLAVLPASESRLVYNIEVEGAHTYAVSRSGVLVHNKSMGRGIPELTKALLSQSRVIAKGRGIRDVAKLVERFGGRAKDWAKKSGPRMEIDGLPAEIHWYEHPGIGRVLEKIKWLD